jgi:hypothetical protein
MRKLAVAVMFTLLVGLGVWYVVTTLPLGTDEGRPANPRTADPAVAPAQGAIPRRAVPPPGSIPCGDHCGSERWLVKTLSDPDREQVRLDPVDATIEQLVGLRQPPGASDLTRAAPVELTVYRVEARLFALFQEKDGDFHLILASPRDSTVTMIAEVPDPECGGACASGFAEVYGRVRQTLMDRLNAPGGEARPLVRVTGVGFFDYFHGQTGIAPNGIELHPVLAVEFADTLR